MTDASRFVDVHVDPGAGCEEGITLRFKRAGDERALTSLRYESESGTDGVWTVCAIDGDGPARAVQVDDSSEGIVWLVVGGRGGLSLTHTLNGEVDRVPYLLLARIETA